MAAMLADAFGAPPDQGLTELARGAAGNPSLLAALIGGLRDEQRGVSAAVAPAGLTPAARPGFTGLASAAARRTPPGQPRQLLMTAAVLGPAFRLEDAAEMLGQTPAALLPAVEGDDGRGDHDGRPPGTFAFRHQLLLLLRRAVGELIPQPARLALHRQYGELLLGRGESADRAASHLLLAADPADQASLAGLDQAAAQTPRSAPQTAAGLAVRALS